MDFNFPESCASDEQKIKFLEKIIEDKTYANEEERVEVGNALVQYLNNRILPQ